MNLKIYNHGSKIRGARPEVDKITVRINELKVKMADLWEKSRKINREILDISIEIDELLNEYYREIF